MVGTDKPVLVVVGNGMVGHRFVESLVELGGTDRYRVVVFGAEPRPAYDRVHLSEFFNGKRAEDLALADADDYARNGVELHLNDPVEHIDREARCVTARSGLRLRFDKLVLATGSYPFVPPIEGNDRPHCHVYRTIEDLEAMAASGRVSRRGVVVGGGLLGLECANALKHMGLEVHVVEFAPQLMAVQLDPGGGAMLRRKIEKLGVVVHTGKNTQRIVDGESHRHRMVFADGEALETDMIVFSAGIRPADRLAREAGLAIGGRGGVVIDDHCRSSDADIYAIGECASWNERVFGLVAPGYQMAKVAAAHLCGAGDLRFTGADMSTKLKLMGVDVGSIGDAHGRTPGARVYSYCNEPEEIYKRLVVSEDGKRLLGAVLVGDASDYGTLLQTMLNGLPLPEQPDTLILPRRGGAAPAAGGVDALPESAQICSCHDVSKGALCRAIAEGHTTVADLKACTKAGTGCGGCVPLITDLLKSELERQGIEVSNDLCEHFPYTRQALYHIVLVENIKTFDELIARHGRGLGCDICKPAVASILASAWNEYILDKRHAPLQDTNDYFLANMQKDGTYSVVPRVPGGEITPDKLIAIGRVAKKYKLYTKITGGQRIDLFGAKLHQLPDIWRELIEAGFETGHAYGKAMRTVKSCVGSTWCRYGVLDSVGMAIRLEHRYKGLRAPHKLKFAVSGCTRECAEAQCKDVGVIATENGWNLYVCGNGGMKPRHADLFATGLDDETLIKYIDRFLIFYVRTADRLQRTARWLESLEGGLDYLKSVIIDDALGICEELERQMQHIVETYECEWKKTLESPEALKRFRTFVNSDADDDTVVFVEEREQIRPATREEKDPLLPNAPHGVTLEEEVMPMYLTERIETAPAAREIERDEWLPVCRLEELDPGLGVRALVDGEQVALFRLAANDEAVYAIGAVDPFSGAAVLSRGIVGDLSGEPVVASPLYKQHFSLRDGHCLEQAEVRVPVWPVRVVDGVVQVGRRAA
ncbi:MAG: nitrite reductase large subunit [Gammaproteobacteria bacterium]|nr:MAG: nitrite reductase large subunit [Gammaproteobacteria bacterium]